MKHVIHHYVQVFFVNRIIEEIELLADVLLQQDLSQLLEENREKAIKREKLVTMKKKIDHAKRSISNIK
jgi:hypothetical protein